ncbi:MAG: lysine--tRNA ligase [Limisphaerales bacterium]
MDDTNALIEQRRAKLRALEEKGIHPFQNKFTPGLGCGEARSRFLQGVENPADPAALAEGATVALAGRITAHRDMGKSQFLDLKDASGRVQIYAQKQTLGDEQFDLFKHLDLADFIGVHGTMFRTRTGEPSVKVERFTILAKALRPPPAAWHGLEDTEIRYRQRYLDLMANDQVRQTFLLRSRIVREIRNFLHDRDYVEVETPMMQAIPGGAAANPFVTDHHALGCKFYLRIALELYLKRLLVGGIDKVFEIGRNFRNEGLSRRHNPEFTMLEAYAAFGDYATMMELVEGLICHVSKTVLGTLVIETKDAEGKVSKSIDLTPPWRRVTYKDLFRERIRDDWWALAPEERLRVAQVELGVSDLAGKPASTVLPKVQDFIRDVQHGDANADRVKEFLPTVSYFIGGVQDFEVNQAVFEKHIEPTLINPTFVTHVPKELVPLAKLSPDDPTTVEVFECCINGQEIAPGYTEQNDPIEQRERLEHQAGGEQQKLDEDFLVALEHGMPPAGGIGLGIDRLCMMLLGQESIRDVILFPQLKPKS